MRKSVRAAMAAFLCGLATAPSHAQMAVVDVGAISQLIQQIRTAQQQLGTLRDQLAEARRAYAATTGPRGYERLLSGTARNYLPANWNELIAAAENTQSRYRILAGELEAVVQANAGLDAARMQVFTPAQRASVEAARRSTALRQVIARQGIANSSARFAAMEELISSIARAQDPRAISELQARIAAEQTMLTNEQTKLQALYRAMDAEASALRLKRQEEAIASFTSMRSLPPVELEN